MTVQDLGSIGELIAAVATIATLVYLAIQIRANTQGMKVESIRAGANGGSGATLSLANNAELADIFHRGLVDLGSLTAVESNRFTFVVTLMVNDSSATYFEDRLGVDSTYLWRASEGLRFLRAPGGRTWWAKNKRVVEPDFAAWIETELDLAAEHPTHSTAP